VEKDTAEVGSTQQGAGEQLVQAMDISTGQLVDLPAEEVIEIAVVTGEPCGTDSTLFTPSLARLLPFNRGALVVKLEAFEPPVAHRPCWLAVVLRDDGSRVCFSIPDLAEARHHLFDALSEVDRQHLAAPFLSVHAAA
jgi:hypothetical protein